MSEGGLAAEVQAWVDANWDTSITVREWWRRLADAGYAYPSWPAGLGGGGLPRRDAMTIAGVLARNGVIGPPVGAMAATLAAPTLLEHATEAQLAELVRPIATGEAAWCQLFSEPGSGSDLASVGTRAVPDGDEWVVTGQKVWNSAADSADFGMLLARTDVDVPKHAGLTYFAIDMKQPGIEARPLKQMNGASNFCEVFLTEARVGVTGSSARSTAAGGWRSRRCSTSAIRWPAVDCPAWSWPARGPRATSTARWARCSTGPATRPRPARAPSGRAPSRPN